MNTLLLPNSGVFERRKKIEVIKFGVARTMAGLYGASGLYGAEGVAPSGVMSDADLIRTVPGQRGTTLDGQSYNEIWANMQAQLAAFNINADILTALFSFPTFKSQERIGVPTSGGFERATELGRPSKVRTTYVYRGFPLVHYDIGEGYSQEFLDGSVGAEIAAIQAQILNWWVDLRKELVLEAIMTAANGADENGTQVIRRLYNADGEVPPKFKRWTHDGTHTHYLPSSGSTFVTADLAVLEEHLVHHGFGTSEGGGVLFLHAHRTDLGVIRGFSDFVPAESGDRPVVVDGQVIGPTRIGLTGFPAQGYVGKLTIVENNDIPAGYLLAHASLGAFNRRNVVGLRSHENPSARGLRLVEGNRQNYPLIDSVYDGYMGTGVAQRGAAVVMEQGTDPYTTPTFDV